MKYEKIKYPDGQISVKITDTNGPYEVKERINSYEDLFLLLAISSALRDYAGRVHLTIPCLFGQRSDRRFDTHQSFDLEIVAALINGCNFNQVSILDPHSDIATTIINRSEKISSKDYVKQVISAVTHTKTKWGQDLVLVSPDAGAYKKTFSYGEEFRLPVVAAVKHRDLDGKVDLQFIGDVKDKDCLIVDDLCDGGYTFIVLARKLKEQGAKKVYLYISHAYFSKGLDVLKENIDHVFCTNSVKDIEDSFVTQFKVI